MQGVWQARVLVGASQSHTFSSAFLLEVSSQCNAPSQDSACGQELSLQGELPLAKYHLLKRHREGPSVHSQILPTALERRDSEPHFTRQEMKI